MKLFKNKDGWKRVRLDEVVVRREENDRENARECFDTFVKVEHMEAESLHLQGLGTQKDEELPPTFYKIFRKGQILFPTRNPHLRRTALAPCDGICGEKTLTLEVNDEVADPRLIPFLFHSASFYDHSAGAIIGSTNPHCRWRDIANYEFLLPPKDQQAKLAELLWAADGLIQQKLKVVRKIDATKEALIEQHLQAISKAGKRMTIAQLSSKEKNACCGGPFGSDLTTKDYVSEPGVPVIRGTNLTKGGARFVEDDFVYVSDEKSLSLEKNSAHRGDIVMTQRGTLGQVGLIPPDSRFPRYIVSQSQMKVTIDEDSALPEFVYYYLLSRHAQRHLEIVTISTGVPHINLSIFKQFPIPVPSLQTQTEVVSRLKQIDQTIGKASEDVAHTQTLQRSLINQIF
ncbi:MAG: restriction endonuclease subunit S [Verrucomicrobiales bacterium]|nr:restriction endonuclease subunit S [Verrucomicrobiae bacterium]